MVGTPLKLGQGLRSIDEAVEDAGFLKEAEWASVGPRYAFDVWEVVVDRASVALRVEFFFHRTEPPHIVAVTVLRSGDPTDIANSQLNVEIRAVTDGWVQPCSVQKSAFSDADPIRCYAVEGAESREAMQEALKLALSRSGYETRGPWSLLNEGSSSEVWGLFIDIQDEHYWAIWIWFYGSGIGGIGHLQLFDLE